MIKLTKAKTMLNIFYKRIFNEETIWFTKLRDTVHAQNASTSVYPMFESPNFLSAIPF